MRDTPKLGQHFLHNLHYARVLAESVHIQKGEYVLEIGPGKGALTRELLACGGRVVAIERDPELVTILQATFPDEIAGDDLRVVAEDIRNVTPESLGLEAGRYTLAANIPYYITGEIIRQFLETSMQPRAIALLIQKEVARRILDTKESILSLSVKVYGEPKIVATVSKGNFAPPPKVDSAIIVIENISKKNFVDISEKEFFAVVRAGFASKRKKLSSNLGGKWGKERVAAAFATCNLGENTRAEELHLDDWLSLTQFLTKHQ